METAHTRRLGASPGTNKVTVPFYVPPPSVKKTSAEIINEARASIRKGSAMGIGIPSSEIGMGVLPSIRPLDTKRPFTPRERQRTLFGTSNSYSRRPPSSFSLGYLQFQEQELGNTTPPHVRKLNPLPFSPSSSLNSSLNSSLSSSNSSTELSSWKAMVSGNEINERLQSSLNKKEGDAPNDLQIPKFLPRFNGSPPKLRLPAIGSASHLVTRMNQFRAAASLDNLPEEVEGDECESPNANSSDRSTREPPPMRKAYSSPVQRTHEKEDPDKDIFGTIADGDLQSPTSNKRSLNFEYETVEVTSKINHKYSNSGISKKCKGDAWGPVNENFASSQTHENLSKVSEKTKSFKEESINCIDSEQKCRNLEESNVSNYKSNKSIPELMQITVNENTVTNSGGNNSMGQMSVESMEEEKTEIIVKAVTNFEQGPSDIVVSKNESKQEDLSRQTVQESSSFTATHNSIEKEKNALVENVSNKEIIQSNRMFKNVEMKGSPSLPASPDTEYLAKAKEDLQSDAEIIISDNSKDSTQLSRPFKKPDNFKPPKPFPKERIKKNHGNSTPRAVVTVDVPIAKPEVNYAAKDPIFGPIQQAMRENFPIKDAPLINKCQDNVKELKGERAQSAKTTSEKPVKNDPLRNTLDQLSHLSQEDENDIEVILVLSKLYKILEVENAFVSNPKHPKLQSQVIKVIYKFIERSNETLLLQIARIILAFRVTGSNLAGVCKLVFKVSRCDKNDSLFLEDNILELFVEALGLASPLEDAEACVYGYGALKFLTMNNLVLSAVLGFGILELMVLHMKLVNVARAEGSRIPEQTSHALFQLTGALRNVAGEEDMFPQFVSTGAVSELCRAMELFSSDLDVISNVSRTLSIISTHDDCCNGIISYENCFQLFVKLLQKYPGRQDIVVRLGYALGNLMAKSEVARIKLFEEQGAMDSMLNLLTIYLEKDQQMQDLETHNNLITSDAGSNGSVEDVIVKIIRILANMSINPVVGSNLSGTSSDVSSNLNEDNDNPILQRDLNFTIGTHGNKDSEPYSSRFLGILLCVLRRKTLNDSDELTHSALSSLNNLSYYTSCGNSKFGERQLEIAEVMLPVLDSDNRECLVEAMRVYGNLSRSVESRNFLLNNGGFLKLMKFLDSDDRELMSASAGILVNMMADWDKRVALKENRGIEIMIHILKNFCEGDWQLATLICQALWNYCIESNNLHAAFGIEETNDLVGILADYLDEERLFGVKEGTEVNEYLAASPVYQQWEEFAAVATNLLEKIDVFLDTLEPLEPHDTLEVLPSPIEEHPNPNELGTLVSHINMNGHEE